MADDILKVRGLSAVNSQCLRQLSKFHKIPVYLESKASKISKDSITIDNNGTSKTIKMDHAILSAGYRPNQELSKSNVTVIGDANKVGNLGDAVYTGYETALSI